jgi:hypothetical protein
MTKKKYIMRDPKNLDLEFYLGYDEVFLFTKSGAYVRKQISSIP